LWRGRGARRAQEGPALPRGREALTSSVSALNGRVDEFGSRLDSQARQSRISPPARPPLTASPPAPPPPVPVAPASPPGSAAIAPPASSPGSAPIAPPASPPGPPAGPPASPAVPPPAVQPAPAPVAPSSPPSPVPPVTSVPPGARSTTSAPGPQDAYQAAYIDFSKGSYPLAITGFREFLRRYPEHA